MKARKGHPLFIVDIAVPRDVEPSVGKIDNVYLYNIDDLQDAVNQNLAGRCSDIDKVKAVIDEECGAFMAFLASKDVIPVIKCMWEGFESVAHSELDRVISNNSLSEGEKKILKSFCGSLLPKLLHNPTVRLKESASGHLDMNTVEVLKKLFHQAADEEDTQ